MESLNHQIIYSNRLQLTHSQSRRSHWHVAGHLSRNTISMVESAVMEGEWVTKTLIDWKKRNNESSYFTPVSYGNVVSHRSSGPCFVPPMPNILKGSASAPK
ncbi:hypothetical protein EVAR_15136_1 [Eumeta japonica]|uniref:Uncharacterized protein n=1 Tax=Eumeta variegata TaxID=151549 RepID=A0A4C1UJH1_EUMVA|nr:hypothetical protein EVAR_15136_1 [Eumeta japonica]